MKEFGNPLYRPEGEKFEFGYAITTHLSQGSEANRGIYIDEWMGKGFWDEWMGKNKSPVQQSLHGTFVHFAFRSSMSQ